MSGHTDLQLALRQRLQTLAVCTTGTTTLAAIAGGFSRTTGSFLADGFAKGMEVTPAGFADSTVGTVTAVTQYQLGIDGGRTPESASAGRSLTVGLPTMRAWENIAFKAIEGIPYLEEQYLPGPEFMATDGPAGRLVRRPAFVVRLYVPENGGISASGRYADAIAALFAPGTVLGTGFTVRTDASPYLSQRAKSTDPAGWTTLAVTIPCEVRTTSHPA